MYVPCAWVHTNTHTHTHNIYIYDIYCDIYICMMYTYICMSIDAYTPASCSRNAGRAANSGAKGGQGNSEQGGA